LGGHWVAVSDGNASTTARSTYLRGVFVKGMIAMKTAIATFDASGYPASSKMFPVISSLTPSPNIKMPTTIMDASRR